MDGKPRWAKIMVGSVLTRRSSITRGLVSARYALNLRDIPRLPRAGDALRGVSVVLTAAVTLFYALGFWQRLPSRSSKI
ncbi:hypothetical protein AAU01_26090 [Paenarthrobacter aurescens]|uniref:Uncharacterized protein n=1 Tax=Paenarthrobacter aurescens TaxID=43663 RepID=A0A4Y3ND38_PAEAU|nr:hypothetical protein AAU01_26090 [Paenarthrobacter aurescens]